MELTVHAPSCLDGQDRHILVQSAARRLVDFVFFPFFVPNTLNHNSRYLPFCGIHFLTTNPQNTPDSKIFDHLVSVL